eukprot:c20513_g1_i1 orf=259-528(-)
MHSIMGPDTAVFCTLYYTAHSLPFPRRMTAGKGHQLSFPVRNCDHVAPGLAAGRHVAQFPPGKGQLTSCPSSFTTTVCIFIFDISDVAT